MDPRTSFYLNIFGYVAVGLFFVGLGIYAVSDSLRSLYFLKDTNLVDVQQYQLGLVLGAGSIILGSKIALGILPWIKPVKQVPQPVLGVCPHCGAIVEKGATCCTKCGRILAN